MSNSLSYYSFTPQGHFCEGERSILEEVRTILMRMDEATANKVLTDFFSYYSVTPQGYLCEGERSTLQEAKTKLMREAAANQVLSSDQIVDSKPDCPTSKGSKGTTVPRRLHCSKVNQELGLGKKPSSYLAAASKPLYEVSSCSKSHKKPLATTKKADLGGTKSFETEKALSQVSSGKTKVSQQNPLSAQGCLEGSKEFQRRSHSSKPHKKSVATAKKDGTKSSQTEKALSEVPFAKTEVSQSSKPHKKLLATTKKADLDGAKSFKTEKSLSEVSSGKTEVSHGKTEVSHFSEPHKKLVATEKKADLNGEKSSETEKALSQVSSSKTEVSQQNSLSIQGCPEGSKEFQRRSHCSKSHKKLVATTKKDGARSSETEKAMSEVSSAKTEVSQCSKLHKKLVATAMKDGAKSSETEKALSEVSSGKTADSQQNPLYVQSCHASEGSKETIVRRKFMYSKKTHKFWETQPVMKNIGDMSLPEGQIEPATLVTAVKQEPYNLPASYEWTTCDMSSDQTCSEVCEFLKRYSAGQEYGLIVSCSKEFLKWALCPPGFKQSWHIGVRAKTSKILVGFISGVPSKIRVGDEVVEMATINFLCVCEKLRGKRLATVLIREMTRRVRLENIWQAAYTSHNLLPTPVTTCKYWLRMLNPMKVIDVKLSKLNERRTKSRAVRLYKLPDAPVTSGFREMERRDVPDVTRLLVNHLRQFKIAIDFDERDVMHWLLPSDGVVHSFLVENPDTSEVMDFCSFYSVPLTVPSGGKHKTLECAYSYYNVATKTPLVQLMKDALIIAKQRGFDLFYAMDVMHNESFLKELKFAEGNSELHCYLYNHRLASALIPSELGLILWHLYLSLQRLASDLRMKMWIIWKKSVSQR